MVVQDRQLSPALAALQLQQRLAHQIAPLSRPRADVQDIIGAGVRRLGRPAQALKACPHALLCM